MNEDRIEEYVSAVMDGLQELKEEKQKTRVADYKSIVGDSRAQYHARCTDCGVVVADKDEHDRFHSVLNEHALCLAILKVAHISEDVHNRFNVDDRIEKQRDAVVRMREECRTEADA